MPRKPQACTQGIFTRARTMEHTVKRGYAQLSKTPEKNLSIPSINPIVSPNAFVTQMTYPPF